MTPSTEDLLAAMDDCLIAITDGKPIPMDRLRSLPPWRAVLVARVAARAGALDQPTVDGLVAEVARVGGSGRLTMGQGKACPRCGSRRIEVEMIDASTGAYPEIQIPGPMRCLDCVTCDWCNGTGADPEEYRSAGDRVGPPECRTCRGFGYVEA